MHHACRNELQSVDSLVCASVRTCDGPLVDNFCHVVLFGHYIYSFMMAKSPWSAYGLISSNLMFGMKKVHAVRLELCILEYFNIVRQLLAADDFSRQLFQKQIFLAHEHCGHITMAI